MPEVKFKVSNDLLSFFDQAKRKSESLANSLAESARRETTASKEQLRLINDQLAAYEKKNKLSQQIAGLAAYGNVKDRIANIDNRRGTIAKLIAKNESDYRNDLIDSKTYSSRDKRLNLIYDQNSPNAIISSFREYLNKQKESNLFLQLQTKLAKEQVDTIKQSSKEQISQITKGDKSIEEVLKDAKTPTEKLAASLTEEKIKENKEKKENKDTASNVNTTGAWLPFVKALSFEKGLGLLSNIPNAKNQLDFLRPVASMTGFAAGGTAGSLLDLANIKLLGSGLGSTNFSALGSALGERYSDFLASAIERSFKSRGELTASNFKLQALLGGNIGVDALDGKLGGSGLSKYSIDLSKYGLDYNTTAGLQYDLARRQGTGRDIARGTENLVAAELGLGIAKETSYGLIDLLKSTHENENNILKTITSILSVGEKGVLKGDRTFLNNFVENLTKLSKTFLQTTETIKTSAVAGLLNDFDRVGGAFSARDSRSIPLIEQLNNSLVNPGSESAKGLRFLAFRRAFPNLNSYQLMEQMQKGLSDPKNRAAFLGEVDMLGGDDVFKMHNFAALTGLTGNYAAARRLYNNRNSAMWSTDALADAGQYSEQNVRDLATKQVGYYDKQTAEIQNKFVQNVTGAVNMVEHRMVELFDVMVDKLKLYIDNKLSLPKTLATPPITVNSFYNGRGKAVNRSIGGYNTYDPAGR